MAKYRKKPVVIEAVQFTQEMIEANLFDDGSLPEGVTRGGSHTHPERREIYSVLYFIRTLEGDMVVSPGDWVITGVQGEKYPCKPDIFEQTYEAVENG